MAAAPEGHGHGDHGHSGSNKIIALGAMVVVLIAGYSAGDSVGNIKLGISVAVGAIGFAFLIARG